MYTSNSMSARGFSHHPHNLHITQKELATVHLSLLTIHRADPTLLTGKTALVKSDSIAVVCHINKLSGKYQALTTITRRINALVLDLDLTLVAKHIPGTTSVHADRLSRMKDLSNWSLDRKIFKAIDKQMGPHDIDRFANAQNTQLLRYNSRWLDNKTEAVDALAQNWSGTHSFVNAPFRLLPRIVNLIERQQVTATVLAPIWPSQPWFSKLKKIATAPPLYFRIFHHLFGQ